ncbi:MAG: EamA family transporter RarD [Saezia sp.]
MVKGIFCSIAASILFSGLYYFVTFLEPMSGQEVLGWRVLLTFPLISLFIWRTNGQEDVRGVWRRVRLQPALLAPIVFNATMLGFQFWLFMWAPRYGKGLEVSLGYFLLPLALAFLGRYVYGEKFSGFKKLAIACALLGVGNELFHTGYFAWETGAVVFGFLSYFYVRRRFGLNHIGGLWYDMALLVPASLWFILFDGSVVETFSQKPSLFILVLILGLLSATSWIFYLLANRWLPFTLFGLLSYIEPLLLLLVSLVLGESIRVQEWPMYAMIFMAVLLLAAEGGCHYLRHKRH